MKPFQISLFALVAISTASVKLTPQDRAAIHEGMRSGVNDHIDRAPAIVSHVENRRIEAAVESYPAIVDDSAERSPAN